MFMQLLHVTSAEYVEMENCFCRMIMVTGSMDKAVQSHSLEAAENETATV